LGNKAFRDHEGAFFIEGTKLFLEAIKNDLIFKHVFITDKWLLINHDSLSKEIEKLRNKNVEIAIVCESVLNGLSTMKQSEGIICILDKLANDQKNYKSYILLEDIQDPYNVGTIIRTADAAGIECIVTSSKTADIYNEKVLRGSMGSVFHVPIIQTDSLLEFVKVLKINRTLVIGTSLNGDSLWTHKPVTVPFAVVFGNESKGMSEEMLNLCDERYQIPIMGKAESLNVSVAAGIVIFDLIRDLQK
jgi:TrmH family RNA methyltransferase